MVLTRRFPTMVCLRAAAPWACGGTPAASALHRLHPTNATPAEAPALFRNSLRLGMVDPRSKFLKLIVLGSLSAHTMGVDNNFTRIKHVVMPRVAQPRVAVLPQAVSL